MAEFYAELCMDFPLIAIEGPFDRDGWKAWSLFTETSGGPTQVVGEDLTVTGSIPKSIDAVKLCKKSGWG